MLHSALEKTGHQGQIEPQLLSNFQVQSLAMQPIRCANFTLGSFVTMIKSIVFEFRAHWSHLQVGDNTLI